MKPLLLLSVLLILSATQINAKPEYILIRQTWSRGWEMIHVEKPKKKLNKWYYDSKNDTYYRIKSGFGFGFRIT